MKNLALLGSTGSIGINVLNIVRQFPNRFQILGLAAGRNVKLLSDQVLEFKPKRISVLDEIHADELAALLPGEFRERIVWGLNGNVEVASLQEVSMTICAVVGAAGLLPTIGAIEAGKDIGLANKETLVVAGKLVMQKVQENGVRLLPIDSEHSAIFQALEAGRREDVSQLILTASGGPFLHTPIDDLLNVSCDEALAHPNWSMGKKISIDSATMMNKGLEVIEAHWLFNMAPQAISVVVHPQSIVHSLVEYQDGSVLAQLGIPDMKIPIAYALSYPERIALGLKPLNLWQCSDLEFYEPDYARFPALRLAFEALERGGACSSVLNAANEVAVAAFLDMRIAFTQISAIVEQTMDRIESGVDLDLDGLIEIDEEARKIAESLIP
ncbi:MAG: 1-deoxy-D-xylulose-5-phosphate reductoisomerase [Desulfofustis sp.]|nr:1-deoxy-D-xylulose-5-phosphate reductoisomerase [Desulfofustis sp.]